MHRLVVERVVEKKTTTRRLELGNILTDIRHHTPYIAGKFTYDIPTDRHDKSTHTHKVRASEQLIIYIYIRACPMHKRAEKAKL